MNAHLARPLLLAAALALGAGMAAAHDPAVDLQRLLECVTTPEPTPVLMGLVAADRVGVRTRAGIDEVCWPLRPALAWNGAMFPGLCAVIPDPVEIAAHPELYFAGETSPPFAQVWLLTGMEPVALRAWAEATMPMGSRVRIEAAPAEGGLHALACSAWDFPVLPTGD